MLASVQKANSNLTQKYYEDCHDLSPAGNKAPRSCSLTPSPLAGWEGENTTKSLWVETSIGSDHSALMAIHKTDSILGKNKPI